MHFQLDSYPIWYFIHLIHYIWNNNGQLLLHSGGISRHSDVARFSRKGLFRSFKSLWARDQSSWFTESPLCCLWWTGSMTKVVSDFKCWCEILGVRSKGGETFPHRFNSLDLDFDHFPFSHSSKPHSYHSGPPTHMLPRRTQPHIVMQVRTICLSLCFLFCRPKTHPVPEQRVIAWDEFSGRLLRTTVSLTRHERLRISSSVAIW